MIEKSAHLMQRVLVTLVVLIAAGLASAGIYLIVAGPDAAFSTVTVAAVVPGDQEVAWLHPATSVTTWERFVAGLKAVPDIEVDESQAFPEESMKLPAVGVRKAGTPGTLWVRWYKLTGLRTTEVWVSDLCRRQPAPLAIVGGGSSERARELAIQLGRVRKENHAKKMAVPETQEPLASALAPSSGAFRPPPKLPVLLITTATADQVLHPEMGEIDLMHIYLDRSFRFCFTNRQMAEAICDFSLEKMKEEVGLQLTSPRISLVSWRDDPFSEDLAQQFEENWLITGRQTARPQVWSAHVAHSVGALNQPNRFEAEAIGRLVRESLSPTVTVRGRELLVIPGAAAPTRRLLRGLLRIDPNERFFWVVTTGDALDFNSIYRDRRLAWNIEDVPFPLILFMHRNPVEQRLRPEHAFAAESQQVQSARCTGTDDLLLYRDIGQAVVRACFREDHLLDDADQLVLRLRQEHDEDGFSVFDALGNLQGKGGEYLALLRPLYDGLRVLPQARIEVYNRHPATQEWRLVQSLPVEYGSDPPAAARGGR